MARHTKNVTIEEEGRDLGKVFVITEMPAVAGEKWAMQLMTLMMKAGSNLDERALSSGMSGLASILPTDADGNPINLVEAAAMAQALSDPSLEAWWDCVKYQAAPGLGPVPILQGAGCQIEEIATISLLRMEVVGLHTAFFSRGKKSTTASPSARQIPTASAPTRMSRPRSAQ